MNSSLFSFVFVIFVLLSMSGCTKMQDYQMQAMERKAPIMITEYGQAGKTSSIGGVSYELSLYNLSGKTIKYLYLYVTPYNITGDTAPSAVNGKVKAELMLKGPIDADDRTSFTWENVWFNRNITCIEPNSIEIKYVDGSTETLNRDKLQKALFQSSEEGAVLKSCK